MNILCSLRDCVSATAVKSKGGSRPLKFSYDSAAQRLCVSVLKKGTFRFNSTAGLQKKVGNSSTGSVYSPCRMRCLGTSSDSRTASRWNRMIWVSHARKECGVYGPIAALLTRLLAKPWQADERSGIPRALPWLGGCIVTQGIKSSQT